MILTDCVFVCSRLLTTSWPENIPRGIAFCLVRRTEITTINMKHLIKHNVFISWDVMICLTSWWPIRRWRWMTMETMIYNMARSSLKTSIDSRRTENTTINMKHLTKHHIFISWDVMRCSTLWWPIRWWRWVTKETMIYNMACSGLKTSIDSRRTEFSTINMKHLTKQHNFISWDVMRCSTLWWPIRRWRWVTMETIIYNMACSGLKTSIDSRRSEISTINMKHLIKQHFFSFHEM